MRITDVLRDKGSSVVSVPPDLTVADLLAVLTSHRIGAAVVSSDGQRVEGIVSERDVVRALAERGPSALQEPVRSICTVEVHTVGPEARLEELMRVMTEQRVRHVPVVVDGSLSGIVSIGDIVKRRMLELEEERAALSAYITTGG